MPATHEQGTSSTSTSKALTHDDDLSPRAVLPPQERQEDIYYSAQPGSGLVAAPQVVPPQPIMQEAQAEDEVPQLGPQWPSWLPQMDHSLKEMLSSCNLKDLLPSSAWEELKAAGVVEFAPVESLWQQVLALVNAPGEDVASSMLASLLEYNMVGYVDSMLLARKLRYRITEAAATKFNSSPNDMVVGTLSSILSLEEQDTILGIMEKSGTIGAQVKLEEPEEEGHDGELGENKKSTARSPLLSGAKHLCSEEGLKHDICKEATVLSTSMRIAEAAVDAVADKFDEEVDARVVLHALPMDGLCATALSSRLFLAKYDKNSPTYRSVFTSLYAGIHLLIQLSLTYACDWSHTQMSILAVCACRMERTHFY